MTDPKDTQKLRAMLAHWIHHNAEHGEEFRLWGSRVKEVSAYLDAAAQHCDEATFMLQKALDRLGGMPDSEPHHDHTAHGGHA